MTSQEEECQRLQALCETLEKKNRRLQAVYAALKRRRKSEVKNLINSRIRSFHRGQGYMREKISQIYPAAAEVHVDYIEPMSFTQSLKGT